MSYSCVESDDVKIYFFNKLVHRLDGPAKEWKDGTKEWWVDGKRHRVDGPAIEYENGENEWWYDGKHYQSEEDWFKDLPREDQVAYLFNMRIIK